MVDHYTKFILTVIALTLVALVVRPAFEPRVAGAQFGSTPPGFATGCGDKADNACYVRTSSFTGPLEVRMR